MRKLLGVLSAASLLAGAMLTVNVAMVAGVSCTSVTTSKGALTAAQVGGNVTGTLDATGCDIGVYYDAAHGGKVKGANISGASQYGVFVDGFVGNVSVNVLNTTVTNIGNVAVYYNGLGTLGAVSGTVSGNTISNYFKGGVVVNGNASAKVAGNSLTGAGPVSNVAQNGIQFGYGGSGQAQGNTVVGNWYTGTNWTSTGILVFESDNVNVDGNVSIGNQTGLDAEAWCWVAPSASNNKFINNVVTGADYGVVVAAYSVHGYSACDAAADNNKVTNNDLSGTSSSVSEGVFVGAYVWSGSYSPEAVNNKVIHNTISGFDTPIDTGLGSATKVHANAVS